MLTTDMALASKRQRMRRTERAADGARRRRWSSASPGTTASCRPHATNTAADSAAGAAATAGASAACITAKRPRRRAVQRSGNAQLRRHVPAGSDGPGTVGERLCCGFCQASRARAADGFARSGVLALSCIDCQAVVGAVQRATVRLWRPMRRRRSKGSQPGHRLCRTWSLRLLWLSWHSWLLRLSCTVGG